MLRPTASVVPVQLALWDTPSPHVALLHKGARGQVALCRQGPTWLQDFFAAHEAIEAAAAVAGRPDTYCSQNTFATAARRIDTLKQLRALFVDVDCYRAGLAVEAAHGRVEALAEVGRIPWPSAVLFSGRGLAAIWLLKPAPAAALPRWSAVERQLCTLLAEIGADPASTDGARVLRVAGTVNSRSGAVVRLLEYRFSGVRGPIRYELADLARQYLPTEWHTSARFPGAENARVAGGKSGKPSAKKAKPHPLGHVFTPFSLHIARLEDLGRLGVLRKWDLKGHRELFCFLWRYWSCCVLVDPGEGLRQTQDFNTQFREPLTAREVARATRGAEKAWRAYVQARAEGRRLPGRRGDPLDGYHYSNERLVDLLAITEEEQHGLKTIILKAEKRRRKNATRSKGRWHKVAVEDRIARLQEALAAHPRATQSELARILGWHQTTVSRTMAKAGLGFMQMGPYIIGVAGACPDPFGKVER